MTTLPNRASAPRLILAGVAALLLAQGAGANVYGAWSSNSNFKWRVTNMTDLDQRRSPGTGRPGLPNNGAMYCVPTATLNVACYVANHGYPFVLPGAGNYQSNTASRYNSVTSHLTTLGVMMGTSASGGTGGAGNLSGNLVWFNGNFFDVVRSSASGFYAPLVNDIGLRGLQGGLSHFAYGRYEFDDFINGVVWLGERTGGHACTANRVDVSGSSVQLKYRDPADEGPNSSQSAFVNKVMPIQNRTFRRNDFVLIMSEMVTGANDGILRIIDSVTTIFPRYGLTNVAGEDGGAQSLRVIIPQPLGAPGAGPHVKVFPLNPGMGPLLDVAASPDRLHYLALADDGAPGFPSGLYRVDPFSGQLTQLLAIANPRRMAFSRYANELFIGETRTLHRVNLATNPPTIVQQATVPAGLAIDALAFHDGHDEVYVLSGFDDQILRYQRTQIGVEPPAIDNMPTGAQFLGGKMFMDIRAGDGSVLVACDASTTVARLTRVTDSFSFHSAFTVPTAPRGVHLDDTGQALVLGDGSVRTFKYVVPPVGGPGAWQEQATPWSGVPVGTMLHITRSVSDDNGEHEGPAYRNLLASEIVGGVDEIPCLGDANADDRTDFLDLNIVLSDYSGLGMWLEGDVNDDGVVDFLDLNDVLSSFGQPCPE